MISYGTPERAWIAWQRQRSAYDHRWREANWLRTILINATAEILHTWKYRGLAHTNSDSASCPVRAMGSVAQGRIRVMVLTREPMAARCLFSCSPRRRI